MLHVGLPAAELSSPTALSRQETTDLKEAAVMEDLGKRLKWGVVIGQPASCKNRAVSLPTRPTCRT